MPSDGGNDMLDSFDIFPNVYMLAAHPRHRFEATLRVMQYFNFKLFSIIYQAVPFALDAIEVTISFISCYEVKIVNYEGHYYYEYHKQNV